MVLSGGLEVKKQPFHGKSMAQRGAVGAGGESKPKQKQTHPKQNRFKPGVRVGVDPFACDQNETIEKRSPSGSVITRNIVSSILFGMLTEQLSCIHVSPAALCM